MEIVFATGNPHKLEEIKAIASAACHPEASAEGSQKQLSGYEAKQLSNLDAKRQRCIEAKSVTLSRQCEPPCHYEKKPPLPTGEGTYPCHCEGATHVGMFDNVGKPSRHCEEGVSPTSQSQGCDGGLPPTLALPLKGEVNNLSHSIEFILPPEGFNPVENGSTFEENSLIKAKEASRLSGKMSLADDSGLCVEALNGAPGLYSARYAGTQQEKIDKILKELEPHTNRKAKFVCVMTLVDENGEVLHVSRGECHGEIAKSQSGVNGFGYDPVFVVENTNKTMAEMSEDEKNLISHRGNALREMISFIKTRFL